MTNKITKVGLMLDIETLDTGPRAVVTQIALHGWDLEDTDIRLAPAVWSFLPIQPQLQFLNPRTISAKTIGWWIEQGEHARAMISESMSEDFEELPSLMRHFIRGFNRMTNNGEIEYELWARGPQFDVVIVESLLKDCGLPIPWRYDRVRDLRTLMAMEGISSKDVPQPTGFIPHQATWDCEFQIACYVETMRVKGSRS